MFNSSSRGHNALFTSFFTITFRKYTIVLPFEMNWMSTFDLRANLS